MTALRSSAPPVGPTLADGQTLHVDGRVLDVRVSTRRARLGLTVERDGSLVLRAPEECDVQRAEGFVHGNRRWIESKLQLREERSPLHPTRKLGDGEIHRYLGREYRLLHVDEPQEPVRLIAGRLRLDKSLAAEPECGRRALADWYCRAGLRWATGRLQPWAARMEVHEPTVEVRDVGHRWGTYRSEEDGGGRMTLHWAVFQLPIHLVDYVIAHELAHIRIAGHRPEYWRLLARALPEYDQRKAELDEMGRRVWLGEVAKR